MSQQARTAKASSKVELDKIITNVLDEMSSKWVAKYSDGSIRIQDNDVGKNSIIIETVTSKMPNISLDLKHRDHIEKEKVSAIIKIILPNDVLTRKENIQKVNNFEYVIYTQERYPTEGTIRGTIHNIGFSILAVLAPIKHVIEYLGPIQHCINVIEKVVENIDKKTKITIAKLLNQPDDVQTWRMAGLILSNAMVFYDLVSGKITLKDGKKCRTFDNLYDKSTSKEDLVLAWKSILEYNYNPIFSVAINILSSLGERESKEIMDELYKSSNKIREKEVAGALDMYGRLLQQVIVDRDNLASYYTRPEAAALMAKLAIPEINHPIYTEGSISNYTIADFACGTGLLLSFAYKQLRFNYEASWVEKRISLEELHKNLMENCFVGLDVLPIATHLAVSSLAMMLPTVIFGKTKVKTMPIGLQRTTNHYVKKEGKKVKKTIKHYRLGSLDLIKNDTTLDQSIKVVTGKDEKIDRAWSIEESHHMISDGSCSLVCMNPPFVRATNHEGKHKRGAAPAWAAFGTSDKDQKNMGKLAAQKFKGTCAHGHAGLASYFIAICDKKVSENGTIALILPATISRSDSWNAVRNLFRGYDIKVISIARSDITIRTRSFSSDTGMGEVMLIATKRVKQENEKMRGLFVSLYRRSQSILDAQHIANAIHSASGVDRLETRSGGTTLRIGSIRIGSMMDCPLDDGWPFVNVVDPLVEQTAYHIVHERRRIITVVLETVAKLGPDSQMIIGKLQGGPFTKSEKMIGDSYLALWNNVQKQQTQMLVPPDKQLVPKKYASPKHIAEVWATASYVHININPDYTANSLIAAYTTVPALGGSTWPSVLMDRKYEKPFVVWCNSTFGILCYWSLAGKQQLGRGRTSRTAILNLPVPDFAEMDKKDLDSLSRTYDKYHKDTLDRIKNLWKDKTRMAMDDRVARILGINLNMDDIRVRLCMEPSISGGRPSEDLIKKHGELVR